ncbi:delta-12-fatty acid desaturase [Coprinopsis cinerea okayama7|uniref:Delta-12-fatty acid desaturase n=1 Tax=Coprinopsis cinerea (strain Okayama-7 / 130 / ATCC MYA-4618 / FGSC 9003) TaxID=240176 RepID=A8P535_COPC7|nr:delta-12-fatty acid desaturase [Coprinopsis cinerea okayama7\|eukprot:XP_001838867.2 delta-12-fatty acid desaturase [Coprinopsis cinerea okayama7\
MFRLWGNGPEYEARLGKPFAPPTATLKDIHDAVPKQLLRNDPFKSTLYLVRDIVMSLFLYTLAQQITSCASSDFGGLITTPYIKALVKGSLWCVYWWFQSLVNAGIFCLAREGHDAGHGTLYDSKIVNNTIGFVLHSYLLIPYFSWRATHHAHHKATSSMERDENYVPYTRSKYNLPDETKATKADYEEIFEETPLWTLWRMFVMQMFGWWVYLSQNTMGAPMYPPGTNHFNPNSALFKPEQPRQPLVRHGFSATPDARQTDMFNSFSNSRIVMFTYLHHSDPTIPHYRKNEWTFLRGAAATVDRPLLGWMGRFFFHNISHDHVAHHFFLRAPFYNGPEITKRIKAVLKDDYNYDSTPSFYALYRSFTQCLFVDDDGDIIFYKNKEGKAVREVDPKYLAQAAARRETQTQHPPLKED